jgi:hypothetical protein
MRNKFKQLLILTALVVLFTAGLVAVKSLNIQPKLIVSSLAHSAAQLCTYLNNYEFLLSIDKIFAAALVLLLIIIRASMLRIVTS